MLALGASISLMSRINTDASMHGIVPQDYSQAQYTGRFNNPAFGMKCLCLFDSTVLAKANSKVDADAKLKAEFNERAERWEKETAIHSAPGATFLHKDYIAIISKGVANRKVIVPLILKRLPTSGADWFFALENIAEENPAKDAKNFEEAFNIWCGWAKTQGLIKETNEVLAA